MMKKDKKDKQRIFHLHCKFNPHLIGLSMFSFHGQIQLCQILVFKVSGAELIFFQLKKVRDKFILSTPKYVFPTYEQYEINRLEILILYTIPENF